MGFEHVPSLVAALILLLVALLVCCSCILLLVALLWVPVIIRVVEKVGIVLCQLDFLVAQLPLHLLLEIWVQAPVVEGAAMAIIGIVWTFRGPRLPGWGICVPRMLSLGSTFALVFPARIGIC